MTDFTNKAEFTSLEHRAFDGTISLDDFPAPEYRYFDRVRRLYERYKFEGMPLEKAQEFKQIAYREYTDDKTKSNRYTAAYAQHQEAIRLARTLRAEALKCTDKDELICLLADTVGAITLDEGFARKIKEKWSEDDD